MSRGDELIELIKISDSKTDKGYGTELWHEIAAGYPADRLAELLQHNNDYAASEAAWLLSEVGRAEPHLLKYSSVMQAHTCFRVRYFLPDLVLLNLSTCDTWALVDVLKLLGDSSDAVRGHTIYMLTKFPEELLLRNQDRMHQTFQRTIDFILESDLSKIEFNIESDRDCILNLSAAYVSVLRQLPRSAQLLELARTHGDPAFTQIVELAVSEH